MKDQAYCVVANFNRPNAAVRLGSKVFIVGGSNGDGWQRRKCVVRMRRNGVLRCAWVDMRKLTTFRAAWLPDHIRAIAIDDSAAMSKAEASKIASLLNSRGAT